MVLICGRGGMGKSTLIVKLIQELREKFDVNGPNPIDAVDCIIFIQLSEKGNRTPDRIIELLSRTLEPEAATELDEVWNRTLRYRNGWLNYSVVLWFIADV